MRFSLPIWLALAVSGPIALAGSSASIAAIYKCVDKAGKSTYQDAPCNEGAKSSTVQIMPAQEPSTPKPPDKAGMRSTTVANPTARQARPATSTQIDTRGPLETWSRFTNSLERNDKQGALNEMTPAAREKYGPVLDALSNGGNVPK